MSEDPTDAMAPWTVKSLPTRTRQQIMTAARQAGLTVGQWLEKQVDQWVADGSPTALQTQADRPAPADAGVFLLNAAAYMQAAAAVHGAGLPVSRRALGRVQTATEAMMRETQGLAPLQPRLPAERADATLAPPAKPGEPRT